MRGIIPLDAVPATPLAPASWFGVQRIGGTVSIIRYIVK
jgi:hypothetical protein